MQVMTLSSLTETSIIIELTIPGCIDNQVKFIPQQAKSDLSVFKCIKHIFKMNQDKSFHSSKTKSFNFSVLLRQ